MDIQMLANDINKVLETKRMHPYVKAEWICSGALAKTCAILLKQIAEQLHQLIIDKRLVLPPHELRYSIGTGMGYFPRSPWISFLVDGAKTSNGIFPVMCFDDQGRGFMIGCADSIMSPQPGFSTFCYTPDEIEHPESIENSDVIEYSAHLAKGAIWFPFEEELTVNKIVAALEVAFEIHRKARALGHRKGNCENERWYDEVQVVDCFKWLEFVERISGQRKADASSRCWVFRGQGNAKWHLSSSLERTIDYRDTKSIAKAKENEKWSLQWFRRISSQKLGYRQIADVDLVSLIQHYGGKTRLLDFSFSPLVALYMAIEQWNGVVDRHAQDPDDISDMPDFAVWAIDLQKVDCGFHKSISTGHSNQQFHSCVKGDLFDVIEEGLDCAIAVVPNVVNTRLAAQEGLFLMSNHLATPLEATLQGVLSAQLVVKRSIDSICADTMFDDNFRQASAYKFVFSGYAAEKAKAMLAHLCITPRMIYPDLSGMAKDACSCF